MKRQYIWILIGLMAVALLGIIAIQSYWIRTNISLNQAKFDKEVSAALNHVEKALVEDYNLLDMNLLSADPGSQGAGLSKLDRYFSRDSLLDITQDLSPTAYRSRFTDKITIVESMQLNSLLAKQSLEDRIGSIEKLNRYIEHQLERRNIMIDYDYGIFSSKQEAFVIQNGHYIVLEEDDGQFVTVLDRSLLNSPYSIALFLDPEAGKALGKLFIAFPNANRVVFEDLWPTILMSVLFTAIILLCFVYTIQIIFRQKKLSEMTTDFINNMTHEFKTPIATINLAADSITSPMVRDSIEKVGRFTRIIKQENKRMLGQVEKVLQMALLEKRDFKLTKTALNLHEIINQAVEHVNLEVQARQGLVETDLQAKKPVIYADQTHLTNIVRNLLDNANKYSRESPKIVVSTRDKKEEVEISFQDNGIGMTREQLKHIFDKFYRVHTGNLHDVKGFGLGLSYVKAMVEAHKGSIDVTSEPGVGTRFSLTFPRGDTHEN